MVAQRHKTQAPGLTLQHAIAELAKIYNPPEPPDDPVALLVWENIGYLIDDERRAALLAEFEKRIGFKAARIANAPTATLVDIARRGGMNPQTRVERLKRIGEIAIEECDGGLAGSLKTLPLPKAHTLLKKFPAIGDPGADKILLFANVTARPALDSNGLRALVRMGFCAEEKSYGQSYKAAVAVLAKDGKPDAAWLKRTWLVLREHGKTLCKRTAPICEPCPLDRACAHQMVAKL
jgi:endonuclease-3